MLPSITKKYCDHSTDSFFAFSFFCDNCGGEWKSETYPFSMADTPTGSEAKTQARTIIWMAEHDAAYERANNEALFHFNKCPKCKSRVCDNCFCAFDDVCIKCKNQVNKP